MQGIQIAITRKTAGKISVIIFDEMIVISDKLLKYNCMTPTQHKKLMKIFNLLYEM